MNRRNQDNNGVIIMAGCLSILLYIAFVLALVAGASLIVKAVFF